jgi:hypothetical protein
MNLLYNEFANKNEEKRLGRHPIFGQPFKYILCLNNYNRKIWGNEISFPEIGFLNFAGYWNYLGEVVKSQIPC